MASVPRLRKTTMWHAATALCLPRSILLNPDKIKAWVSTRSRVVYNLPNFRTVRSGTHSFWQFYYIKFKRKFIFQICVLLRKSESYWKKSLEVIYSGLGSIKQVKRCWEFNTFYLWGSILENGGQDCYVKCKKSEKCNWCEANGVCCRNSRVKNGCDGTLVIRKDLFFWS